MNVKESMTVRDLYEWAVAHGIENYTLRAQFRDDNEYFPGDEDILPVQEETGFVIDQRKVILV